MNIQKAKEIVCEAGLKLVKEGLVARTWGNISCRVDNETFVITPSGRTYEELTPDDIVPVKIADCSWTGTIKPSSEKGIHATVYQLREKITAVIHTHQKNASVVASARRDIILTDKETKAIFGGDIACATYGLPGTSPLKKGAVAALKKTGSKATILANHGAVCIGENMEEAFKIAILLEEVCQKMVQQEFFKLTGVENASDETIHDYYLTQVGGNK